MIHQFYEDESVTTYGTLLIFPEVKSVKCFDITVFEKDSDNRRSFFEVFSLNRKQIETFAGTMITKGWSFVEPDGEHSEATVIVFDYFMQDSQKDIDEYYHITLLPPTEAYRESDVIEKEDWSTLQ